MTEAELLATVRDACRWSGLLTFHAFDSRRSEAGPDLCVCGPSGVLFRELKSSTGRLSPDQVRWLDRLNAAVWYPHDWPHRVLDELASIGGRLPTRSEATA